MSTTPRVPIKLLPTGVAGLDNILGGGLPEFSFNLISGTPGAGKTTLAQQIMFTNASTASPAVYFTIVGEPPIKMLRYQQQMAFFDSAKVGVSVHFVDLSAMVLESGLDAVLEQIIAQVSQHEPTLVIVDSFQAIIRAATARELPLIDLLSFTQRLAVYLTSSQATTFLIGEYLDYELQTIPVLAIADGIITLSQQTSQNSVVRKLQVVKSRGHVSMPGLHTFHISQLGLEVFPRMSLMGASTDRTHPLGRGATGVAGLDALMGGGIPRGDAVMVSGPSGTGKSVLATQFISAGVRAGEPGVIAVFEEHPAEYVRRAASLGIDLATMEQQGHLKMIYIRPLDLSPDETLAAIRDAVQEIDATRVVIDSISGFELALAPGFRADFRESLYRLVGALTGTGILVLMTMEIIQSATDLRFSPYIISFLTDDIILLRYIEMAGQLRKSITIVKMRNSAHSRTIHMYDITDQGMIMRESLEDYRNIGTGAPELREDTTQRTYAGLIEQEIIVLRALIELQEASAEQLAARTGIAKEPDVLAALDRLVYLDYAAVLPQEHERRYRPIMQQL